MSGRTVGIWLGIVGLLVTGLSRWSEGGELPFSSVGRQIEAKAEARIVELGQKIPLKVRFRNDGAESWTLETPERSRWVSIKCVAPTHQQSGFTRWYCRWIVQHDIVYASRILVDNPIMENYSFGFGLGSVWGSTVTLKDGTELTSRGYDEVPEIEIKPKGKHDFEIDIYRHLRSRQSRERAPHFVDRLISSSWRPGPYRVYMRYRAGRPDLPHRIQSRPVEFSLIVTEKSVDHLLQVVKSPAESRGPREWAGNLLWLLKPHPALDWPRYDATAEERDRTKKHNQQVLAEFEEFWREFRGTDDCRRFLRELNSAYGIDEKILDQYFPADGRPPKNPDGADACDQDEEAAAEAEEKSSSPVE